MKNKPSTLRKLLNKLKPMTLLIVISLLCALFIVSFTLLIPVMVGKSIDLIIDKNNVNFDSLYNYFIIIGVSILAISILQWVMSIINNKITYSTSKEIRNELFKKTQRLPLSYLDSKEKGNIVSIIINDVDSVSDGLLIGFTQLFTGVITIVGTLAIMIYYCYFIAVLVFVLTPLSIFVAKIISSKIHNKFEEQAQVKGDQTAYVEEMINNQKVVHAFSYEEQSQEKFDKINNNLRNISLKALFYSSLTNPCTRCVNAMVYAGVAILSTYLIVNNYGGITIGLLATFLSYANQYTKPFNEISGVITEMQNSIACAERIFTLLEEDEMVDESNKLDVKLKGDVTIKDVYFSYDKDKPLIEGFNFKVKKGQKVAIVGPTGCGKTTFINLLMKFYDANKGNIFFDEYNINDVKSSSIRNNIGMVLQDTWLKSGTIKENICFSKEIATEQEIYNVLKESHCLNFVEKLPQGIDTIINEDGGMLSTGQKQLLCIARLMLINPPILILDEATSSIDTITELKIQDSFEKLMENKTTFIVAHRLSTIVNADLILVMKDGHIIEQGNHQSLLEKDGFYKRLYLSQFNATK